MKTLEIAKELYNHLEEVYDIKDYYGLLAAFALAKVAIAGDDDKALVHCKQYLDKYPDEIVHPDYNFEDYRCGGNGKAYLLYMGKYKGSEALIREYAEKTLDAPCNDKGIICDPSPRGNKRIWIDVVTAITPFMLYAGLALNEPKYYDYAAEQCILMYEEFLDPECGLVHQAKGFFPEISYEKMSDDHWGRGNGWAMVGFAELIEFLPKTSKHYKKVVECYKNFCAAIIPHQSMRGLWRQEMPMEGSWEESSGTGLLTYGIGVGIRMGILTEQSYKDAFENALNGIVNYCITERFETELGCEGMCCPGVGEDRGTLHAYVCSPRPYRDEPHSHGSLMLALAEAHKNGITDLTIRPDRKYINEEKRK